MSGGGGGDGVSWGARRRLRRLPIWGGLVGVSIAMLKRRGGCLQPKHMLVMFRCEDVEGVFLDLRNGD